MEHMINSPNGANRTHQATWAPSKHVTTSIMHQWLMTYEPFADFTLLSCIQ